MKLTEGTVVANGKAQKLRLPCGLADFLTSAGWRTTQVVVELNGKVLRRSEVKANPTVDGEMARLAERLASRFQASVSARPA